MTTTSGYTDTADDIAIATNVPIDAEVAYPEPDDHDFSTLAITELLLKDQRRFDRLARTASTQQAIIPRLLAIGIIGYAAFGIALSVVFLALGVWPELTSAADWLRSGNRLFEFQSIGETPVWQFAIDGSALKLTIAYTVGLLGALGICLPSFYFYGLLASVRTSMLQITTLSLKSMASAAIALMGVLPIYCAIVLGLAVLQISNGLVDLVCYIGLALPFVAGLWGTWSLFVGFLSLADTMEPERRCRRECFLRRLLVAWCGCFTAVTPVVIFTLWQSMSR